jgi:hypothetical protein
MPYVNDTARRLMRNGQPPSTAGELNYAITKLCDNFVLYRSGTIRDMYELRYDNINEVIGVLECAKQEFYRRIAVPLENEKIADNGDVYSSANLPASDAFVTLPDALNISDGKLTS